MKQIVTIAKLLSLACVIFTSTAISQVADGVNKFGVTTLSPGVKGTDSLGTDIGRDIVIVPSPGSLDGDNLTDIVVTDYEGGGRVHVFEQESAGSLKFNLVWTSKTPALALARKKNGPGSTPRTVVVGDLDGNGRKEIIFPVGRAVADSVTSDTTLARGLYIYEWNGTSDNNYGANPLRVIKPEEIDSSWKTTNFGRNEGAGLIIDDVDGDGKNELLFGSREFGLNVNTPVTNMYILQVQSGTFAQGNAVVGVEYVYKDMKYVNDDGLKADSSDGFIPFGMGIADIDGDGKKEILVGGWTNVSSGSGLGFIDVLGANSYKDGTVMAFPNSSIGGATAIQVSFRPAIIKIGNQEYIYFNGDAGAPKQFYTIDGVTDVSFVSASNIKRISSSTWTLAANVWGGLSAGNQDHGTGTDGSEVYLPNGNRIASFEYKGSGDPTDSLNYVFYDSLFVLTQVFKSSGGAITDVMTYPGMDLNNNGLREVIVNYKPGTTDTLWSGKALKRGTYGFFVLEWGAISVSVEFPNVVPDQFSLDQNYPNPFNPSTTIKFHVPSQSPVSIKIFDIVGREIRTLIGGTPYQAGNHQVLWDGKDNAGATVATGTYFYRMDADNFSVTRKMMVLK